MGVFFKNLPADFEKWRVHEAVRDIVQALQDDGGEFATATKLSRRISVALNIQVGADAIRFFMAQEKNAGSRINKGNVTLAALYDYIVSSYHNFPKRAQERYLARLDDLNLNKGSDHRADHHLPSADARFAIGTQDWVHTSPTEVDRLGRKFQGSYALLRKSTIAAGTIMRSTLDVQSKRFENRPYVSAAHLYHDRYGRARSSKGFLFPVIKNVYGPLQIEDHEGLEVLVIRDPVQEKPGFLVGFMFGLNGNRTLYNSTVLLERIEAKTTAALLKLPHRFSAQTPGYDELDTDFRTRLSGVLREEKSRLVSDLFQ
ncbi:MAG: hypothetical protein ACK5SX_11645 [Sandaracinobacter sp.]